MEKTYADGVHHFEYDLTDEDDVEKFFERLGSFHELKQMDRCEREILDFDNQIMGVQIGKLFLLYRVHFNTEEQRAVIRQTSSTDGDVEL